VDNNWKTATKADRAALYHVARAIADTTDLSMEAIMEQAFGHKLMVSWQKISILIPKLVLCGSNRTSLI